MKYQLAKDGGRILVKLAGKIDSAAKGPLFELRPQLTAAAAVVVDLGEITVMDSIGVSHWLEFVQDLDGVAGLTFINCRSIFLSYLLMIPGFLGAERITSFYVPYTCAGCGYEMEKLVAVAAASTAAAIMQCPECGKNSLEPLSILDDLLAFFATA